MCGIVGVAGHLPEVTRAAVEAQSAAMECRGPDGSGFWSEGTTMLAHRRLKIIDLTERSRQPIVSEGGRHVLTYNGEIYNFRTLCSPALAGDTLTLIDGAPLATDPTRLRGMFAYGLWDRSDSSLLLVRDRFGIKPLYYSERPGGLTFGSTAASVGEIVGRRTIDSAAVASYLRAGSVQGPQTIFEGVRELEPGTSLKWSEGRSITSRYWSFEDATSSDPPHLRSVLLGSVEAHGVSDVPIALFLSGGVDSAILGALAVEAGLDLTAFTLGFPGSVVDEVDDASVTASALGLKHQVVDHAATEPDFEAYFASIDQPSIDGLNTYLVSEAAARSGFRVAMTGLGADELFGGYSTFRRIPLLWALNAVPSEAVRRRVLRAGKGNQAKAVGLLAAGADVGRIHEELRSVFTRPEIQRLTGQTWEPVAIPAPIVKVMDSVTHLEIDRYMRNTLLRDADVFSMCHSLELRTPFVDHHVLEAALSVSNLRRARLRKRLLAIAVGNTRITELMRKPKRGFRLPMDDWLKGTLAGRVADLEHGPLTGLCDRREIATHVREWGSGRVHHSKIWTLVVLDAWLRKQSAAQKLTA